MRSENTAANTKRHARGRASSLVSDCIFAATGVGLTLPGALLPALLLRWSLSDAPAGVLFFLFFIGSMAGALLARGALDDSVARGCVLVAMSLIELTGRSGIAVFAWMLLFGVGLGIIMTSISLLQSRAHPAERVGRLSRLNFLWAAGACCGPWIGLHGSAHWGVGPVLCAVAGAFALGAVAAVLWMQHVESEPPTHTGSWLRQVSLAPSLLLLMVPLSTGIESTTGGWLATFAHRAGATLGGTVGAVTWFWVGMLLSRLVQSHAGFARRSERTLLRLCPLLMTAGLALILCADRPVWLGLGALALGLGIGPMYPLALALVLAEGERGNAVFLIAGLGSSLLPLLTGVVSSRSGSLRGGLLVPLCACVVLAIAGIAVSRRRPA